MKKYFGLFVFAVSLGILWDFIQGLKILGGKGESMYINFALFAIPSLLITSYILKSNIKVTLVFWLKHGFLTWLALTPLFFLQTMASPETPFWGGAVLSFEWLPITASAVVLFRAWSSRRSKSSDREHMSAGAA